MKEFVLGAGFMACCVVVAWLAWNIDKFHSDPVCPQTVMACVQ